MLATQAFEVLALRPGATSSEIKEAYRDLVKVWHPDRFGNDGRLREKAEHQLKLINEAYRTLQSDRGVSGMYAAGSGSAPGGVYRSAASGSGVPQSRRAGLRLDWRRVAWISGGVGLVAVLLGGYLAKHDAKGAIQQIQGVAADAQVIPSTSPTSAEVRPGRVVHTKDPGLKQFSVRSLSEAESDKLQMRCSAQRRVWGDAAYQACLRVQVAMLMNPTSAPDLSALDNTERESIESTCSEARHRGPERYNRCLTEQVASLAAEPARPDLSALSEADRHEIESACRNAKEHEGPAAYNRCLEGFIQALAK